MKSILELQQEIEDMRKVLSGFDGHLADLGKELKAINDAGKDTSAIRDALGIVKAAEPVHDPIMIEVLKELDEYARSLFLKMLCTCAQYENSVATEQKNLVRRIAAGLELELEVEDYMRQALQITDKDVKEFIDNIGKNDAKYHFALDAILVISLGQGKDENYEYVSELMSLLGVDKRAMAYLSKVAKSIIAQDSKLFDEAKTILPENLQKLEVRPYIGEFYAGAIIDTELVKYYSAPTKEMSTKLELPRNYNDVSVTFENLRIEVKNYWNFTACEYIIFKNCMIVGTNGCFLFHKVGTICFENTVVKDFTKNRFAYIETAKELLIKDSVFMNCGANYGDGERFYGGLICADGSVNYVTLENNKFIGIYGGGSYRNSSNYGEPCYTLFYPKNFIGVKLTAINNEFGVDAKSNGQVFGNTGLFPNFNEVEDKDNQFTGYVKRLIQ